MPDVPPGGGNLGVMFGAGGVTNPIRPGEPDCAFFLKTGTCKFGETCKFNHPPPGSRRPGAPVAAGPVGAAGAGAGALGMGMGLALPGEHPVSPLLTRARSPHARMLFRFHFIFPIQSYTLRQTER